jgi:hypothetical protein
MLIEVWSGDEIVSGWNRFVNGSFIFFVDQNATTFPSATLNVKIIEILASRRERACMHGLSGACMYVGFSTAALLS